MSSRLPFRILRAAYLLARETLAASADLPGATVRDFWPGALEVVCAEEDFADELAHVDVETTFSGPEDFADVLHDGAPSGEIRVAVADVVVKRDGDRATVNFIFKPIINLDEPQGNARLEGAFEPLSAPERFVGDHGQDDFAGLMDGPEMDVFEGEGEVDRLDRVEARQALIAGE